jgi:hypothetical protein
MQEPAADDSGDVGSSQTTAASAGHHGPGEAPDRGKPSPAETEETLLKLALAGTASHVETVVRALRRRQAQPWAAAVQRCVSWHWAEDGSLVLRGRLTPVDGAVLIAAVDALVPARHLVAHPVPSPPDGWRARSADEAPGAVADRLGTRRADALLALATGTAITGTTERGAEGSEQSEGSVAPVVGRGQARIVVHVDAATGAASI